MKKEFQIGVKLDNESFNRDIEALQKRLKEIYSPADQIRAQNATSGRLQQQGFGGIMSAPGQAAFEKATQQQRRDQDQSIREQAAGQEKLGKMIAARIEKVKELQKQQSEMVKDSEKELALKEKIARVEENTSKMRESYKMRDATLNQALTQRANPSGMPSYPTGYSGPANTTVNSGYGAGLLGGWGHIGKIGAGVAGAIGGTMIAGSELYRAYGQAPIQTAGNMGSAMNATLGRDVGNAYGGRTAFEGMFSAERMKALGMAGNAMATNRTADKFGLAGHILGEGFGGAASGAVVGGAMTPMLGFAGALPGAIIGGIGGVAHGAFGDSRRRSLALSPFSSTMSNQYESTLLGEYGNNYTSSYQGLKDSNPNKKFAMEDFEKNMGRNLGAQRSMGLSNGDFYGNGGYLNGVTSAGFTHDQGIGMSNSIMGAGGSTRMARDSAFGLQMERMGQTNAGGMLGSLSNSMGSPESSKRATIEIMAEAMSKGLDNSDYAEENRKFTSALANIIGRTGATGEGDQARISGQFGQFMAEKTGAGIEAAGNSYEKFQERGSQLGGRRGALRMVSAMQDPSLSKLGQTDLSEALSIAPEERNENNEEFMYFAKKAGIGSAKEFAAKLGKADKDGRFELPGQRKRYEDAVKSGNKGEAVAAMRMTESGRSRSIQNRADAQEEMGGNAVEGLGPSDKDLVQAGLGSSQRMEDKFNQGAAGDAEYVRKNFNDMSSEMDRAASAAAKMTDAVRAMTMEFINLGDKPSKASIDAFVGKYGTMSGSQPQSNKGSR